jgi:hypothetical protein
VSSRTGRGSLIKMRATHLASAARRPVRSRFWKIHCAATWPARGNLCQPETQSQSVYFSKRARESGERLRSGARSHNSVVVWPATLSLRVHRFAARRCCKRREGLCDSTSARELRRKCRNIASSHRCWPDCGKYRYCNAHDNFLMLINGRNYLFVCAGRCDCVFA